MIFKILNILMHLYQIDLPINPYKLILKILCLILVINLQHKHLHRIMTPHHHHLFNNHLVTIYKNLETLLEDFTNNNNNTYQTKETDGKKNTLLNDLKMLNVISLIYGLYYISILLIMILLWKIKWFL